MFIKMRGFSLLEVAIVLFIMALLLGTTLGTLTEYRDVQNIKETKKSLEEIKNALLGYVLVRGFFPCPDTNNDGIESTGCSAGTEGYLPYASLGGIGEKDSWGNHFRYRVDRRYATYATTISTSNHITNDKLTVCSLAGTDGTRLDADENGKSRIVAIVFSYGKNGVPDAKNAHNGSANCTNSTSPLGAEYTQDVIMPNFDDILMWISKYTVIHELANAGKWK